jgi:hypothetical protein
MNKIYMILFMYISYYTFQYAGVVWREESKFAAFFVGFLAVSILPLAYYVLFMEP